MTEASGLGPNQAGRLGPGEEVVWGLLLSAMGVVLRRLRLAAGTLAVVVGVGVLLALRGLGYVSSSSFTPEAQESNVSRLAGLAAQFGVSLGGGGQIGDPVQFYAELLTSRELLEEAVKTRYRFATSPGGSDSLEGTLVDLYQIEGSRPEDRLRRAVDRLRRDVAVSTYRDAGLVRLRVRARWPELAVALNRRLLDLVSQFNVERRQSQAAAQRRFLERRLEDAKRDLQTAEDDVRRFLERNRRYQDSPELVVEMQRLQRVVDLRQQVFTQLAQAYEQARMDEVRNTPVVTVVENPEGSARRAGNRWLDLVVWVVFGTGLAVLAAYAAESWERYRMAHPDATQHLTALGAVLAWRRTRAARPDVAPTPEEPGMAAASPPSSRTSAPPAR
jgi:uncharacterized protein involved in exopolysaccharide biosynthesis